jgi:prepilin peptidase CpaA
MKRMLPAEVTLTLELLVAVAALYDVLTRRIPNWLTLSGVIAGFAINFMLHRMDGLRDSLLGLALAFTVYFALFAVRAMGGGDVKLMAAVGAFVGWKSWASIFVITAILGGAVALVSLATRGGLTRALDNVGKILGSLTRLRQPHLEHPELDVAHPSARTLPHGAVIAAGTLLYILFSR